MWTGNPLLLFQGVAFWGEKKAPAGAPIGSPILVGRFLKVYFFSLYRSAPQDGSPQDGYTHGYFHGYTFWPQHRRFVIENEWKSVYPEIKTHPGHKQLVKNTQQQQKRTRQIPKPKPTHRTKQTRNKMENCAPLPECQNTKHKEGQWITTWFSETTTVVRCRLLTFLICCN